MSIIAVRRPSRPAAERKPPVPWKTLQIWLDRSAQRRALRELAECNAHLLADIGLSRDEALREAAKPFWRR